MAEKKEDKQTAWRKILAQILKNDILKQRLLRNPKEVLKESGYPVEENVEYVIHKNDAANLHIILLQSADLERLDEAKIKGVDPQKLDVLRKMKEVQTQALKDKDFRQRLLRNPREVLKESGYPVEEKVHYFVHENTNNVVHLTFFDMSMGEMTDEMLKQVSGGYDPDTFWTKDAWESF